jgi:hypothetical protein
MPIGTVSDTVRRGGFTDDAKTQLNNRDGTARRSAASMAARPGFERD